MEFAYFIQHETQEISKKLSQNENVFLELFVTKV